MSLFGHFGCWRCMDTSMFYDIVLTPICSMTLFWHHYVLGHLVTSLFYDIILIINVTGVVWALLCSMKLRTWHCLDPPPPYVWSMILTSMYGIVKDILDISMIYHSIGVLVRSVMSWSNMCCVLARMRRFEIRGVF